VLISAIFVALMAGLLTNIEELVGYEVAGEKEVFEEKPIPVPLRTPQIPH
jgi:hypothetical protein